MHKLSPFTALDIMGTCLPFTVTTRIWDNPFDGQVRLTRGTYSSQGLVEVYCNGQWGTVCNDEFDQIDADTICRQLGYTEAARNSDLLL